MKQGWVPFVPIRGRASEYLGKREVIGWEPIHGFKPSRTKREAILTLCRNHDSALSKMSDSFVMLQWRKWKANKYCIGAYQIRKVDIE